jgi:hypothetical protein
MNLDDAVLLRTYSNEVEANIVASRLESEGIDAYIGMDDCGGAYPALQMAGGVRLLVKPEDLERAEKILREIGTEDSTGAEQEDEKEESESEESRPRFMLRGGLYFLFGLAAGYFLSYALTHWTTYSGVDKRNWKDGRPGSITYYVDGVPTLVVEDRNYDGKPDARHHYEKGKLRTSEYDDTFQGRKNRWTKFKDPFNCVEKVDTDSDGKSDVTHFYVNGLTQRVDWHPKDSSTIERRELYKHGLLKEKLVDTDGDGIFDRKITYDDYERPIAESKCRIPDYSNRH